MQLSKALSAASRVLLGDANKPAFVRASGYSNLKSTNS
jgi:hypothetical protein